MTTVLVLNNDNTPADVIGGAVGMGAKLKEGGFDFDSGRLIILNDSTSPDKPTVVFASSAAESELWDQVLGAFPDRFTDRTADMRGALAPLVPV